MNEILIWLLKAGLVGTVFVGSIVWAFLKGKDEKEKDQLKAEKKANAKAKSIQDRVVTDSSYRDRVRKHYDGR